MFVEAFFIYLLSWVPIIYILVYSYMCMIWIAAFRCSTKDQVNLLVLCMRVRILPPMYWCSWWQVYLTKHKIQSRWTWATLGRQQWHLISFIPCFGKQYVTWSWLVAWRFIKIANCFNLLKLILFLLD